MASTNIFNPSTGWDAALGFNPNWNYGSARKTAANYQTNRPRWGSWQTRSVGGGGYSFDLTFVDRPIEQVHYIRRFYEQYQRGFFTLVDYDNGGREHVGRFTSYTDDTETANTKYTVRVLFEEIPGCPMRNYPQDWLHSSNWIYTLDDFLNVQPYGYIFTGSGSWVAQQTPAAAAAGTSVLNLASYEFLNPTAGPGDFAQVEYVGWGFRATFRLGSNLGLLNILLDDVTVALGLDLTGGSPGQSIVLETSGVVTGGQPPLVQPLPGIVTVMMADVPLGRHRIKIASDASNPGSSGSGIMMPAIQVIH